MITGKTLIDWGFKPGPWFGDAIKGGNEMLARGADDDAVYQWIADKEPEESVQISPRTNAIPFSMFLEPESPVERDNHDAVVRTMDELMRVPTVVSGAVMPDACPAGTIPVGGVVATKNAIHPGFHSADVCCSMAITVFKRDMDLGRLLDVAQKVTHFGPGGRKIDPMLMSRELTEKFTGNSFLFDAVDMAHANMGTQGDGNHFLFVGRLRSTGQPAMVTHHGSRGVGALLYKRGMRAAQRHTAIISPRTPKNAAWIDAESDVGRAYWDALQIARLWTKENHFVIHDLIQQRIGNKVVDRFWNEHNFVFRRDDGLFYHAKGATPSFAGFSLDDDGRTLIPLNMAEPVLITQHTDNKDALGFAPHGAGRNMSRTAYMKMLVEQYPVPMRLDGDGSLSAMDMKLIFKEQTRGIDARFYLGTPDLSELPAAYKSAEQVQRQIDKYRLAKVIDYVDPYGCIMAGELNWQRFRKGKS